MKAKCSGQASNSYMIMVKNGQNSGHLTECFQSVNSESTTESTKMMLKTQETSRPICRNYAKMCNVHKKCISSHYICTCEHIFDNFIPVVHLPEHMTYLSLFLLDEYIFVILQYVLDKSGKTQASNFRNFRLSVRPGYSTVVHYHSDAFIHDVIHELITGSAADWTSHLHKRIAGH